MKYFAAIFGLMTCTVASAATLPDAPSAGSKLEALDRNLYQCVSTDQGSECRRKGNQADRIATEPVIEIVLFYRDDTLVRSVFAFGEAHLEALVEQLSGELGTPQQGSELLIAGMGGVFENRYYTWRLNGHVWFVEQYFERVTSSGLWRMDAAEFAAFQSERDRVRVRGARDL